ncbi:hypothetical protein XENOCAPTIV_001171, partial [Xenoophorus captivus]
VCAVQALAGLVVGKSLQDIVRNFRGFYRLLTSDGQMRWDPKQIVSCIDFRYIGDVLTEEEALGEIHNLVGINHIMCNALKCCISIGQASALQFVQIDSCRLGSVNENLAVLLMAHKFKECGQSHRAAGNKRCEVMDNTPLGITETRLTQLPYLESCDVCNHVGEKCITGDVERHPQTHVGGALVQLTGQFSIADVKLTEGVAGGQSHEKEVCIQQRKLKPKSDS